MLKQEESRLVYKLIDLGYAKELGVSDDGAYIASDAGADDVDDDSYDYHNDVPKRVPKRTEACFYFMISSVCPNHYVIVFGVQ